MKKSESLRPVLDFLADLAQHNDREWFEKNRTRYDEAKTLFESFADRLIAELSAIDDLAGLTASQCVYRIYRDVRFSPDKSPYKTHMAAAIMPGGRKSSIPGFYVHIEPNGKSILAGGLYQPSTAQLAGFRSAIAKNAAPFKVAIGSKTFKRHYGTLKGEQLKTIPRGFSADHPEIDLLRHKQVLAYRAWTDDDAASSRFEREIATAAEAMKPFLDFIRNAIA